jgi:hypothetical protein
VAKALDLSGPFSAEPVQGGFDTAIWRIDDSS